MVQARAVRVHENGGPEVLKLEDVDVSAPGAGEVLIRQTAIGLNFIDTYIRTGLYPTKLPVTPGFEGAGIIEAVGESVEGFSVGDRVAYPTITGAYATHVCDLAAKVVPTPDGVADEDAAAAAAARYAGRYAASMGCGGRRWIDCRALGEGSRRECHRRCVY